MPDQTRDHRRAVWMASGNVRGTAHLVYLAAEWRAVCGRVRQPSWTPVAAPRAGQCRACDRNGAKRSVVVVGPEEAR